MGGDKTSKGIDDRSIRPAPPVRLAPIQLTGPTRMTRRTAMTRPERDRTGEVRQETRIDRHNHQLSPAGTVVLRMAWPCPPDRPPSGRLEGERR